MPSGPREDVRIIRSRRKGEDDVVLRPVVYRGAKLYAAKLPAWDRYFPSYRVPEPAELTETGTA